jgi:signal transduction histidine kinase
MNFRQRLFLWFAVIILTATFIEFITDYVGQRQSLTFQVEKALDTLEDYAAVAVRFDAGVPVKNKLESIPFDSRIRVLEGNNVLLSLDQTKSGAMFSIREKALTATQRLELSVDIGTFRSVLMSSFWRDVRYDIFNILITLGLAWWVSGLALRPLERLAKSMKESSVQSNHALLIPSADNDILSDILFGFNHVSEKVQFGLDRERILMSYTAQEMTTPLQSMAAQIEALEMGSSSEEEVLPIVQRNVERMQQVLRTLPSLAQMAQQKQTSVSLIQILKETIQFLPDAFQDRIALKISMTSNPKVLHPTLVTQCVLSLLDNALQSKGEVRVMLEPYEALARVRIEEYGSGLSDEALEHLKKPFFRLPKNADQNVLRLAFVKHIVMSLGGVLDIRNTARGLEVLMTLPVDEVSLSSTQINPAPRAKIPLVKI